MSKQIILDKRNSLDIIFYDGTNKDEVRNYFIQTNRKNLVKFLIEIDGEFHYKVNSYDTNTLIKPNLYLSFKYDEDDWWYISKETKESFDKNFISITVES